MKKSTLYAPRLRGDIDLGLEPSRVTGDGNKAWARMDFPGRRLPGLADHDIYTKSATQKFEIGTRRIEYGRTFRYSKAGGDITYAGSGTVSRLLANANYVPDAAGHIDQDGFIGNLLTAGVAGATYVDLNEPGEDTVPTRLANFYQGGYFYNWDHERHMHYIVASDATDATKTRIYLDHPLTVAIATGLGVEVFPSPYSNVVYQSGSSYMSYVGVHHCLEMDEGDFFWLQTAGPCQIPPINWDPDVPGMAAEKRDVYAHIDGTLRLQNTVGSRQRIGYLLSATAVGYGAIFIMLQLE